MSQITIAIPQMGNDLFRRYMKGKYVQSLRRSGADVCWIELENPDEAVRLAASCDGLLLPGGADVEPSLYGQTRSDKTGRPNAVRDRAEPKLLAAFLDMGKPVLGICRGVQMMNVSFGGTLFQDIKDKQTYKHSDFFSRARSCHPVEVITGTKLFDCMNDAGAWKPGTASAKIAVNSIHHQAIDKLGDGLVVSAKSTDGFVEGIELKDYRFCAGVQWHPEHMSARNTAQQALFDAFVKACKE